MNDLTNKQKLFCQEYIKNGGNGMQAYYKSYKCSNDNTAKVNASKLLTKTNLQDYIQHLQSKIETKTILSIQERMQLLSEMALGNMKDVATTFVEGEVVEKEITPKLKDRRDAIDILNKMDSTYTTKININGAVGLTSLEGLTEEEIRKIANLDE